MKHSLHIASLLSKYLSLFLCNLLHLSIQALLLSTIHLLCSGLNHSPFFLVGFGATITVIHVLFFTLILNHFPEYHQSVSIVSIHNSFSLCSLIICLHQTLSFTFAVVTSILTGIHNTSTNRCLLMPFVHL